MSRTSILAILAGAGVVFTGLVTPDAVAFAKAVQTADEFVLERFAKQFPDSPYKDDAIRLAQECTVNWVNGACSGKPTGTSTGGGPNPGKPPKIVPKSSSYASPS